MMTQSFIEIIKIMRVANNYFVPNHTRYLSLRDRATPGSRRNLKASKRNTIQYIITIKLKYHYVCAIEVTFNLDSYIKMERMISDKRKCIWFMHPVTFEVQRPRHVNFMYEMLITMV